MGLQIVDVVLASPLDSPYPDTFPKQFAETWSLYLPNFEFLFAKLCSPGSCYKPFCYAFKTIIVACNYICVAQS